MTILAYENSISTIGMKKNKIMKMTSYMSSAFNKCSLGSTWGSWNGSSQDSCTNAVTAETDQTTRITTMHLGLVTSEE